ncbi:peptidoglycan binding protein CsiV [Shewanella avicenniae]|uniref:Peptidoglycan binding protein CsiV n=1 Tax=Shewanella avicenniae TaxID=2814294 RepID=A0ABX7QNV7_9GAMM|nr:peptidoglycan binding protein CsiV [Shewanella avicenniae]QSX32408.1 peptidoglycan binding protein CsiV [Shewanella avicenniae]
MIKQCLLATLAGLSAFAAQAAQYPWYEVEIFVFERQAVSDEHWPSTPLTLKTDNAIDLITPQVANDITGVSMALGDCGNRNWNNVSSQDFGVNATLDTTLTTSQKTPNQQPCHGLTSANKLLLPKQLPVQVVPANQHSAAVPSAVLLGANNANFKNYIAKLNRQGGIQPLLHMTWQQEMKPRSNAQPLHLFAGKDYAEQFQANGMPVSVEAKSNRYGFDELKQDGNQTAPVWQFDGLLTIYLNHYLFVETRFNLRALEQKTLEGDATSDTTPSIIPFLGVAPMEQNRRIRSTEIHYFDHPRMGMLLQVRKMQQPSGVAVEAEEQADDSADTPPESTAPESTTPNGVH